LTDNHSGPGNNLALVRLQFPGYQLQGRGLACTVATDQANALAGLDGKFSVAQYGLLAKIQPDILEAKQ